MKPSIARSTFSFNTYCILCDFVSEELNDFEIRLTASHGICKDCFDALVAMIKKFKEESK